MHEIPSMSFSLLWTNFLLSSNAFTINLTESCGPAKASKAAICAMFEGFDVEWPCRFSIALMTSLLAPQYPILQPVIAYVLDTELQVMVNFFISSFNDAM